MGHYTTIARFARMSARSRGQARPAYQGGRLERAAAGPRPADDAAYRCPECGDGSVVPADCVRCEVPMYRREGAIELPRRAGASTRPRRAKKGLLIGAAALSAIVLGAVGAALILGTSPVPSHFGTNLDPTAAPAYAGYAVFMTTVFGAIFLGVYAAGEDLGGGFLASLRARLGLRSRRRRMARVAQAPMRALPDMTEGPVRVRGRVRVRGDDGTFEVFDGAARVRVRVGPELSVFDEEGERRVLEDGAEVELVGVGHRPLGAGDAYREARGAFVFEEAEVFVAK